MTSGGVWWVSLQTEAAAADALVAALAGACESVARLETAPGRVRIDGYARIRPARPPLEVAIALAAAAAKIPPPPVGVQWLAARDWLKESLASLTPLDVGRFHMHGSHQRPPKRSGQIPLQIDAAMAFGSGHHASTAGCLVVFDWLRHRPVGCALDVGCGSGILAIAAAKLWRAPVAAVDIDPIAVGICAANARLNGVGGNVRAVCADGYAAPEVRRRAPFDLIVSNILARPLQRLAGDLHRHLRPGGLAVLAGFIDDSANAVMAVHAAHGLRLVRRLRLDGWTTLVLEAARRSP